ncbi:MAG: alpha/beta fold hydrolase [Planctomycetota bacterium]
MRALTGIVVMILTALCGCYHFPPAKNVPPRHETVVCVHGLFRTVVSMKPMAQALAAEGYDVHVVRYLSTRQTVTEHIAGFEERLAALNITADDQPIHFVTYSLGGIVVRGYLAEHPDDPRFGRVVMIAPPNQGSAWADRVFNIPLVPLMVEPITGLRTEYKGVVEALGTPVGREVGVIAGGLNDGRGFASTVEGDDDGIVTVAATHLAGEKDHIVLPYRHHGIAEQPAVIAQAVGFIKTGRFRHRVTEGAEGGMVRRRSHKGHEGHKG